MDNKLNNLCNQDDTYDDVGLDVGGDVAGNNDQEMAAQLEAETPGKIWYKKLSIVQQRQVDTGIGALMYADDDDVVGDLDLDNDWAVGGGVASNNNQKIAAEQEAESTVT